MNKFKIGDMVKVVRSGYGCCDELMGGIYKIIDIIKGNRYVIDADKRYTSSCLECSFELAWQPEPGEMIEVSDREDFRTYDQRHFVGMHCDQFVCAYPLWQSFGVNKWQHARPIKKTHTITLEDKSYEVDDCVKETIVRICEVNTLKDGIKN